MTSSAIRYLLLGLLSIAFAACGSQPRTDLANLPGKDACLWPRNAYDWTVLDDSTLIVPSSENSAAVKNCDDDPR